MNERFRFEFENYFQRNYSRVINRDELGRFGLFKNGPSIERVIANSIENFEKENSKSEVKVRTDAKLFLTINYANMVYYPLVSVRNFDRKELQEEIYKEVQQILMEAYNETNEITAHKVIEAGNRIWDSLKTLGNGSW